MAEIVNMHDAKTHMLAAQAALGGFSLLTVGQRRVWSSIHAR